jgi:hypothetical protein
MAKPRALFHPDCDRRPRDRTESADPTFLVERGRSRADAIARNHRRWGLSPRPENACPGTIPKRRNYPVCAGNMQIGPLLAPMSLLRGRRLLLKVLRDVAVQPIRRVWLGVGGCGPDSFL